MAELEIEVVEGQVLHLDVEVLGLQGTTGVISATDLAAILAGANPAEAEALAQGLAHVVAAATPEGRRALKQALQDLLASEIPELVDLELDNDFVLVNKPAGDVVGTFTNRAEGSVLTITPDDGRFAISGDDLLVGSTALSVGDHAITITETLSTAVGSPHDTALTISVGEAAEVQIATSVGYPSNRTSASVYTTARVTRRWFRNCRKAMTNIRLVYANSYLNGSGAEMTDLDTAEIFGSIQLTNGTVHQTNFGSNPSATVLPGAYVVSDIIPGLTLAANEGFFIITGDEIASGGYRPSQYYLSTARGEGLVQTSNHASMLDYLAGVTPMPVNGDGWNGFGPIGILGQAQDGSATECVMLLHDSLGDGTAEPNNGGDADGNRGYMRRGFAAAGYCLWPLGRAGSTLQDCLPSNAPIRSAIFASYGTSFIDQLGENSQNTSDVHLAYEAHVDAWAALKPIPAVAAKVLVKTTSVDGWATEANQTVASTDRYADVVTMPGNPRFSLRVHQDALVGAGKLAGTIDGYPYIVSPTVPDKWNSVGETATARYASDAVHPTTDGHIAMVPAVTAAIGTGLFDL